MDQMENTRTESKRKRSVPTHFEPEDNTGWTYNERETLLTALKKYGHLDLENLHKAVPTKSHDRIKSYINVVWKQARRSLMESAAKKFQARVGRARIPKNNDCYLGPIDQWLERMKSAQPSNYIELRNVPIVKSILYYSKFDHLPHPSECGGVDFRAMYDFLYCMLCGYPAKTLNPETASFILLSMSHFAASFKEKNFDEEIKFLTEVKRISYSVPKQMDPNNQPSSSENKSSPDFSMEELLKIPGFNPLGVPNHMLWMYKELEGDIELEETILPDM